MANPKLWIVMLASTGVLAAATLGGCGDDSATTATTGNNATSSSSASAGPGGGAGMCDESQINQDDACEVCAYDECQETLKACCEQPGCLDIIECALETGCSEDPDPLACYKPETCQQVIDDAGGIGVATMYASPLGDCVGEKCVGCGTGGGGGGGVGGGGVGGGGGGVGGGGGG